MLRAIYGILYACAHEGWVQISWLEIHSRTTSNIYGSPSEVCVIDELTVFKGLSGDEARPLLYSWFSTTQFT